MTHRRPEVDIVKLVRVAYNRGEGVKDDPVRKVTAYFDMDGALVFEVDPILHEAILLHDSLDWDPTKPGLR